MFERNSPVEEVFSDAWEQVRAGRSIEAVLAGYPAHAAELEPMRRPAAAMQTVPTPTLTPHALGRIHRRAQAAATLGVPSTEHRVSRTPRTLGTRQSVLGTLRSPLAIPLAAVALLLIVA